MKIIKTIIFLLLISQQLYSANTSRDQLKERKIEARLTAINPALLSTFKKATEAMDDNKLTLADSLYLQVIKKAPQFDVALRRLGGLRLMEGKLKDAMLYCDSAIAMNRSAYNLLSLANCYLYTDSGKTAADTNLSKALNLLKEGETLPDGNDFMFPYEIGQIAMQMNQEMLFKEATNTLVRLHPDEMVTHYYAAIVAAMDEEWIKAENEILKAKELGLDGSVVQSFLDSGVHSKAIKVKAEYGFLWLVVFWIAGLFLLYILGKILSSLTLRSIEKHYSSGDGISIGKALRRIYRVLINIGAVYYYFSLPFILIGVLVLAGGLIYLFLLVGRIPIGIMVALIVGSCVTIYWMIRTLTLKVNYTDPGRELKQEEAPGLYGLTAEVAKTIGTRPIDEIRITPATDLAVYERGKWRERMKDKTKRVLILGTGVLKDFRLNDFKAVLAHEYGHFSNRDTAGGAVAMRVRNDMFRYYKALYTSGQAIWWNLAFQFLRLYNFIFRRISHGATRLQEVLADRVAAQTYGKKAFKEGLTYVIKREIEFTTLANNEIEIANIAKRDIHNLYELSGGLEQKIEDELNKELNTKTTEDNTHPCPMDRFRYVDGINGKIVSDDLSFVRDLFIDWSGITQEMTGVIEKRIRKS